MTQQRPALADVLARATTCDDAVWWRMMLLDSPTRLATEGVEWKMGPSIPWARLRGWAHPTPADALAALVEAELLPEHWADDGRAPRWWSEACRTCGGNGWIVTSTGDGSHGTLEQENCPDCEDGSGHAPAPPSHDALVAVASLSVDTIARAEAIVAETWPGARLVWRVESAAKLSALRIAQLFNRDAPEAVVAACSIDASGVLHNAARAAARARGVDHRPIEALAALGLHLVALDAGRVVLAVEALA